MATLKRGILGGFTGSVANIVGSSWKGIDVMRSKPLSVANPRTAAQVAQRGKFASVVEVASFLLVALIKPLWDRFAQQQSGYNAFVSYNIDFFDSSGLVNFTDFSISRGSLTPAAIDNVIVNNGSADVEIAWVNNGGNGSALDTDLAYAAVYNATQDNWGQIGGNETRLDENTNVTMPTALATSDQLHVYLAFRRVDGTIVSNTEYLAQQV